jgi:hypothetical protein
MCHFPFVTGAQGNKKFRRRVPCSPTLAGMRS